MEFVRGLHNLRPEHRGCAATIGNFDGVHLGHQAVLGQLAERASALQVSSLVLLFEPQPLEYFRPDRAPARLTRLREKILALRSQPVERVLCARFDERLAALEAEDFIDKVLIQGLNVRYVVVGDDFRFGKERRGDFDLLARVGRERGFEVAAMPTLGIDGERVSSTRIRAALAAGDLSTAERLLGRPYRMSGRVVRGKNIGRQIGVPTANLRVHRGATPVKGIFAVEMSGVADGALPGVASLGTRPTIGGTELLLEVHVFDFNRDIYGAHVTVDFLQKLRDERRFDSIEAMREQILQDVATTRAYFAHREWLEVVTDRERERL